MSNNKYQMSIQFQMTKFQLEVRSWKWENR